MYPRLIKKSGLEQVKLPMRPSILAKGPQEVIKQNIKKVQQTFKPN
jgi:hypothetical protein